MDDVTIVELKKQTVIGTRKTGSYKEIPQLLCKLIEYGQKNSVPCAGAPIFVCHEKDLEQVCDAEKTRSAELEVCWPLAKKVKATGDFSCYALAGGKFAKVVHKGAYAECGAAYKQLFSFVEHNYKKIVGPIREVYLNDPQKVPESELLTEIYAPLG